MNLIEEISTQMTRQPIEHEVVSIFPQQGVSRKLGELASCTNSGQQNFILIHAARQRSGCCRLPDHSAILVEQRLPKPLTQIFLPGDKDQPMHEASSRTNSTHHTPLSD